MFCYFWFLFGLVSFVLVFVCSFLFIYSFIYFVIFVLFCFTRRACIDAVESPPKEMAEGGIDGMKLRVQLAVPAREVRFALHALKRAILSKRGNLEILKFWNFCIRWTWGVCAFGCLSKRRHFAWNYGKYYIVDIGGVCFWVFVEPSKFSWEF